MSGWLTDLLSKERTIAPPGFNRWKVPPASVAATSLTISMHATNSLLDTLWIPRQVIIDQRFTEL
jgi:hypothetical protein